MKSHFAMMAAYNAWCNERIYDAASQLSDENYRADRGAFFKSVHGTLNHILVADRIWLKRLTGTGETASSLDAVLYDTLPDLRRARRSEDERIVSYVDSLGENDLASRIRYRTLSGSADIEQPLVSVLFHVFNHQTHHRGQVHCILTGLGLDAPSLDLVPFQRETGMGMS